MKLYHGTSQSNASLIEAYGVLPRQDKGNWNAHSESVPSVQNFVYLTNKISKADFYGLRSSLIMNDNYYSVIEVDIDEDNLYPDENLWINGIAYKEDMLSAQEKILENKPLYKDCLEEIGLVSHRGHIPAGRVTNIIHRSMTDNTYWGWLKNFTKKNCALMDTAIFIYLTIQKEYKHDLIEIMSRMEPNGQRSYYGISYNKIIDSWIAPCLDEICFDKWL